MSGYIIYIKISGYCYRFDKWKEKNKAIAKVYDKIVGNYLWRRYKNDEYQLNIYEGNSNASYFLIIVRIDISFVLVRQCDEDAHEAWKALIEKYEVSDEKQEILNEVTTRWNNFWIKVTSQDPDIWFDELLNLNLKFNNIKAKYENDGD